MGSQCLTLTQAGLALTVQPRMALNSQLLHARVINMNHHRRMRVEFSVPSNNLQEALSG